MADNPIPVLTHYAVQALKNLMDSGFVEDTPEIPGWEPHRVVVLRAWIDTKELARRDPDGILKLLE